MHPAELGSYAAPEVNTKFSGQHQFLGLSASHRVAGNYIGVASIIEREREARFVLTGREFCSEYGFVLLAHYAYAKTTICVLAECFIHWHIFHTAPLLIKELASQFKKNVAMDPCTHLLNVLATASHSPQTAGRKKRGMNF